jgi:hypothetical protein
MQLSGYGLPRTRFLLGTWVNKRIKKGRGDMDEVAEPRP